LNAQGKREIASLTKMMTLLCSFRLCQKFGIDPRKCYFRVTIHAAGTRGTSAELEAREWVTVEDLLHGLMLPSGNDAATVLAENLGVCIYYDRLGESHLLLGTPADT
jgi:D-alanyl-D-alanine carboxypeptidase